MRATRPTDRGRARVRGWTGRLRHRSRALLVGVVVAAVGLGMPPASSAATAAAALPQVAAPTVVRYSGADRFATAVAVSKAAFPDGTSPDTVYVATGTGYADALSASAAAASTNGAVLLTLPDQLPGVVATEIRRLAPASIVVLGGTGAVSSAVMATLAELAPSVSRVAGSSRYETSRELVRQVFAGRDVGTVWIATGRSYPDALAAGAAAGSGGDPLLVVDGSAAILPTATVSLLEELAPEAVRIAGGSSVVGASLAAALADLAPTVTRHAGADRYSTAVQVNRQAHPALEPGAAFVAQGAGFADAIAGGYLAGRTGRPLYLTQPYCVPSSVRPTLAGSTITSLRLLGGIGALRGLVGGLEECRSLGAAASLWVVVNKRRPLSPRTYVPSGLVVPNTTYAGGRKMRSDAAAAVASMFAAGRTAGAGSMAITSGYRSYATQDDLYWNKVATSGQAYADMWVARPGHSEHQTGLTLDIAPVGSSTCSAHTCLGSTPQGRWLRDNSWRYGFILRYESGYTSVTGFNSEPWHFRFVGVPLATDYRAGGWHTLEQYVGLPAAPTY